MSDSERLIEKRLNATPVVQSEAQVMERALLRERFADAIYNAWNKAPEDTPMAHLDRYAIVDAILPLVTRERNAARLAALEQAATTICVNCAEGKPLSDGKNGMHLGGLHCYAWAIRALAAKEQPHD